MHSSQHITKIMTDWLCFDLFLISQLIPYRSDSEIDILQVAVSEGDAIFVSDQDGKPSLHPPSCISNHYLRTLLILSKDLSRPCVLFQATYTLFLNPTNTTQRTFTPLCTISSHVHPVP